VVALLAAAVADVAEEAAEVAAVVALFAAAVADEEAAFEYPKAVAMSVLIALVADTTIEFRVAAKALKSAAEGTCPFEKGQPILSP